MMDWMPAPEMFSDRGLAWIKAVAEVANQLISQFGILAAAVIAVWQNLKTKAEVKERLDRQHDRLEATNKMVAQVALATPATGQPSKVEIEVVNPPERPVEVHPTQ